jgi:hypothetical protein
VKVSRVYLLGDLRRSAKREAQLALSSEWYVIRAGIAAPEELPESVGVLLAPANGFEVARLSPKRAMRPQLALWMALARAAPVPRAEEEQKQQWLGEGRGDADSATWPLPGAAT